MTGRNSKKLIKLHRENSIREEQIVNDKQNFISKVLNAIDNRNLVKYQPMNYQLVKNIINEQREAATDSLNKVKRIEESTKLKKEIQFMKQHSFVWLKEWSRLENHYKNIESELSDYLKLFELNSVDYIDLNNVQDEEEIEIDLDFADLNQMDELENYSKELNETRIEFKVKTVNPIYDLIEDLKYYLNKNSHETIAFNSEQNERIIDTIVSVKEQQKTVMNKLSIEYNRLGRDLDDLVEEMNQNEMNVSEGVPLKAYDLPCPNDELKISILQEFIIIDFKYKEKLKQLNESYKEVLNKNSFGNLTKLENELFQHVYEQYITHSTNSNLSSRDLIYDRCKRSFMQLFEKKLDRADFIKHEEWSDAYKYYQKHQKLIVNEWAESKKSLLLKAEAIFAEAFEIIEQERVKNEEKERQMKICNDLYNKVSKWRQEKLEALEIKQKIDELIKRQEVEKTKVENERENKRRSEEKRAIKEYHDRLDNQRKYMEKIEQAKLERLQQKLHEQAEKDRERIEYRKGLFEKKQVELHMKKEQIQLEQEEKERRLEKFYETVKPKVEADPARLVSFTEAELNRRGVHVDMSTQYTDKKPNFLSFNDKQLNSDARLRIEQRLRQAGLLNSEYARALISNVISMQNTQNRRDLNANTAWDGFSMK